MRICIDSCVFIRGLREPSTDAAQVLALISPSFHVYIPRLVIQEVTRNLVAPDIARFYGLFIGKEFAHIVDSPIPEKLFRLYATLGLNIKGDALIGAFAEWMHVEYLISDNRHFLQEVRTDAYRLVTPAEFLAVITSL